MRKIILIFFLLPVSIMLFHCGKKEKVADGQVTITFWHSFVASTVPALNELIDKFEQQYPHIKIKAQYIPTGDALIQKLITAVQSQTAPDISWIHSDYLQDLISADAIYKMEDFVKGENGLSETDLKDIYPALIQYASWRGTLYSIPMEATNLALMYNKRMFREAGLDPEKPPQNWQELQNYAKKLTRDKDGDGKNEQIGFLLPIFPATGPLGGWMVWQWLPYIWQAGGNLINEQQTHILYDSESGIAALTLWQNFFRNLELSKYSMDYDVAFASERLAMAMDGPWNLPRYRTLLKNLDWAFAPLPAGPAKSATIVGGEYLTIFKQSKHPDAAWQFLKWLTQADVQAFWAMKSGYLPIRHAVMDVPEFQEYLKTNPNFKVFVDQMEIGQAIRPIDFNGIKITRHLAEAIERATVGNVDPKSSLTESAKLSNQLLKPVKKQAWK